MTETITVSLKSKVIFWRYQALDITNNDITQSPVEIFLQSVLINENDIVYKKNNIPSFFGIPIERGLAQEFQSIQSKLNMIVSQTLGEFEYDLGEGLTLQTEIWRYQGDSKTGNLLDTNLELFVRLNFVTASGEILRTEKLNSINKSIEEFGLLPEFKSIQDKINIVLNHTPETKTVTLTKTIVFWRVQGDIENNNFGSTNLQFLRRLAWVNTQTNESYLVEELPPLTGTPEELGMLEEFQSLQNKLENYH